MNVYLCKMMIFFHLVDRNEVSVSRSRRILFIFFDFFFRNLIWKLIENHLHEKNEKWGKQNCSKKNSRNSENDVRGLQTKKTQWMNAVFTLHSTVSHLLYLSLCLSHKSQCARWFVLLFTSRLFRSACVALFLFSTVFLVSCIYAMNSFARCEYNSILFGWTLHNACVRLISNTKILWTAFEFN